MKIEAVKRFNGKNPGEIFDADPKDAEKWIGMELAKKPEAKKMELGKKPEAKKLDAPPVNKKAKKKVTK